MLVHVFRDDGSVFQTVAFAVVYGKHWDTEFFILDEKCEFERVFAYKQKVKQIIPQVIVFDRYRFDADWLKEKNGEGYKAFIRNPKLLNKIRRGEKNLFDEGTMILWRSLVGASGNDVDYGPHPVDDEESLSKLMEFTGCFHDGLIEKVEYSKDKKDVTLFISGVWGIKLIKLMFKDVIDMHLNEDYQNDYFYGTSLFFPNRNEIAFTNEEEVSSVEELCGPTYVRAREMSYAFEYGNEEEMPRGGPEYFK